MLNLFDEVLSEPRLERMRSFNGARESIAAETVRRVLDEKIAAARDRSGLEVVLNEVCFHEETRLRGGHLDDDDKRLRSRLGKLRKGLRRMSDGELHDALRGLAEHYVKDVLGNFNPAIYAFASRVAPVGLSLLFSPLRLSRSLADLSQLRERVLIEGQVADLERLSRRSTLVVVPTHLSNLDSIVLGFALERCRLPPCTYGAGKNLFSNPLLGFFMRNLGAYRVDRRIRHDFYKDVLKTYSTVLLERGYHSLFFPGGTRSRSGAIEGRLKLGLLGTALAATIRTLSRGAESRARPILIVPATINYHLVLEAATLIEDFLKEAGKSRYIIEDDESTQLTRVYKYLHDTLRGEGTMTLQFSEPLDVLGHHVAPDGQSFDDRGRPVALKPFLTVGGEIKEDPARDAEYTRELSEKIVASWRADTHVLSTHLVGFVMHRALVKLAGPRADLFRVMRGGDESGAVKTADVLASIERTKTELARLASARKVRLGLRVAQAAPAAILDEALGYFRLFHERPAIARVGDEVEVLDRPLCFYYHNRLVGYGLEGVA